MTTIFTREYAATLSSTTATGIQNSHVMTVSPTTLLKARIQDSQKNAG